MEPVLELLNSLDGRVSHVGGVDDWVSRLCQNFLCRFDVRSLQSAYNWARNAQICVGAVDTSSDNFAVDNSSKNVNQNDLDLRIGGDDAEGLEYAFFFNSTSQVEEVGRFASFQFHNI